MPRDPSGAQGSLKAGETSLAKPRAPCLLYWQMTVRFPRARAFLLQVVLLLVPA